MTLENHKLYVEDLNEKFTITCGCHALMCSFNKKDIFDKDYYVLEQDYCNHDIMIYSCQIEKCNTCHSHERNWIIVCTKCMKSTGFICVICLVTGKFIGKKFFNSTQKLSLRSYDAEIIINPFKCQVRAYGSFTNIVIDEIRKHVRFHYYNNMNNIQVICLYQIGKYLVKTKNREPDIFGPYTLSEIEMNDKTVNNENIFV